MTAIDAGLSRDVPDEVRHNDVPVGYIPRELSGSEFQGVGTDVDLVRRVYEARMPTLLFGPPGTGKTSMIKAALPSAIVFHGTSETESADFVGTWVQRPDGSYHWADGPLVQACDTGVPLLIDEVALIDPRVMALIYPLMDGQNELTVVTNPDRGTVFPKPGFMVFGACNPDTPGSVMSEALLSRFQVHIEVKTDWNLALTLGVGAKIINVARHLERRKKNNEILAAPQLRDLLTFRDVSLVFGEAIALRNFVTQAQGPDRDIYSEVAGDVFGRKINALAV